MKFGFRKPDGLLLRQVMLFGCAALLFCLGPTGCGKSEAPAEKALDTATSKDAAAGKDPSKAAMPEEKKVPAPTLVDQVAVEQLYPNKKPQIHRQVKRYSDNSLVNHGTYNSFYLSG